MRPVAAGPNYKSICTGGMEPFCEPVRAITLDGKCLRGKCEEDHDLGYQLLRRFGHLMEQRLHATRLQLLDVYGKRG